MTTLFRSNFPDLLLETALPAIEKVIQEERDSYPSPIEKIFNVRDMSGAIAQHSQVSNLAPASQVAEGAQYPLDRPRQGYNKTYKAVKYGLMLPTSQEMLDDLQFEVLQKNPKRLARSFQTSQEIDAASVFNNGFSDTGPDGVSLFNTAHPTIIGGATVSNRLAVDADLSITSLQDSLTLLRKTADTAGNPIMITPKVLLVPPELEFTATQLLKSVMNPGTPNNDVNAVASLYNLQPIVWNFLTDNDAFFVGADTTDTELYWFWRKRPEIKTDFEFKSDVALTKMSARWTVSYSDFRGWVGTPGA